VPAPRCYGGAVPRNAHGKICYIRIPATDIERSAAFYRRAFGWSLRTRGDGRAAFDDGLGEVSGECVTGRPPSAEPERFLDPGGNVIGLDQEPS
jgi:uncharacterized protein